MKLSAPLAALLGLLASVTPESLAAPQQQQHVLKRTGEELPARTVNDLSDPFADQFQDLIRRQGQGIGGVGGSEVSGLPTIKHVPFDGNDSLPYSPPFYPSPKTPGKGAWTEAVRKAKDYLEQFTVEEKVSLTTGVGWTRGRCVGNIGAIERIGFPGLCLEDGPLGVRFADLVSVFPAGITTAATFSKELMYERGVAMGEEHRGKGVNIQLGPDVNIVRAPAGGRNWETFGADPYLSGWAAHETVRGIQDAGVQADAKHYINK